MKSFLTVSHDVLKLLFNIARTCPGGTIMPRPPLGAQPDERTSKEGLGGLPPDPPPLGPDMKEDEHQSEQILTGENVK